MPQGRLKVKTQLPANVKSKKKRPSVKGPAISRRLNAPVAPKSTGKNAGTLKLKKQITKHVNESMEKELRAVALNGKNSLRASSEASKSSK